MTALISQPGERSLLDRGQSPDDGRDRSRSAEALGYLSLGLGVTGLVFARGLSHMLGLRHRRARRLTRVVGARELVTGAQLLVTRRPGRWLWARVAGDVIDLSLLGVALRASRRRRGRVLSTIVAVGGITAIDVLAATRSRSSLRAPASEPVRRAITIAVPPEQAYAFWRELENLPTFMSRVVSIEPTSAHQSRWRARGPAGTLLEWNAEIIEDIPDQMIRWRSLPGSPIGHRGTVRFRPAPGTRGTEVSLEVQYEVPAGELGRRLAALTSEAVGVYLHNDLRRLKQILEVGEVVCSDASAHRGLHPARPEPIAKSEQKRNGAP